MTDVFDPKKRSEVMSRIRGSRNRKTELRMIERFKVNHITGWRRNRPIAGHPDFVFPAARLVLFVDGCFWHGCLQHYNRPANNREFWERKYKVNRQRDRLVNQTLRAKGWRVVRVWEHELQKKPEAVVRRIRTALAQSRPALS